MTLVKSRNIDMFHMFDLCHVFSPIAHIKHIMFG